MRMPTAHRRLEHALQHQDEGGQRDHDDVEDEEAADVDKTKLLGGFYRRLRGAAVAVGAPPPPLPHFQHTHFLQLADPAASYPTMK